MATRSKWQPRARPPGLANQVVPCREAELRARVQEVRVVLDAGHLCLEGVALRLEKVELSGGACPVLPPRLLGCVNRGIAPSPRRAALRDGGEHRVPVLFDRIAGGAPRLQLPRLGPR